MKKFVVFFLLVLVIGSLWATVKIKGPLGSIEIVIDEEKGSSGRGMSVAVIIHNIERRLNRLEGMLGQHPKRLQQNLGEMKRLVKELEYLVSLLPEEGWVQVEIEQTMPPSSGGSSGSTEPMAMSSESFKDFLSRVQEADFASEKLAIVRSATHRNYFTALQVKRTLRCFDMDSDKLKALEIMWPRVVDKENGFKILDVFEFSDDKQKAAGIIEG